jgi:hypothetical protein
VVDTSLQPYEALSREPRTTVSRLLTHGNCENKYVLFIAGKFVLICYSVIETNQVAAILTLLYESSL